MTGHIPPSPDPVGGVVPRHDAFPVNFPGPPPNRRQAILQGAGTDALLLPTGDKGVHVLWFYRSRSHMPESQCVQLVCGQVQYPGPGRLCRKAAVAVLTTELHELVVQVFHGASILFG